MLFHEATSWPVIAPAGLALNTGSCSVAIPPLRLFQRTTSGAATVAVSVPEVNASESAVTLPKRCEGNCEAPASGSVNPANAMSARAMIFFMFFTPAM